MAKTWAEIKAEAKAVTEKGKQERVESKQAYKIRKAERDEKHEEDMEKVKELLPHRVLAKVVKRDG